MCSWRFTLLRDALLLGYSREWAKNKQLLEVIAKLGGNIPSVPRQQKVVVLLMC